ncbi:MAG: Sensor histidine kinase RcsC [bacterium]|nr:Sensor histidine kinase RcsC [bacterium]
MHENATLPPKEKWPWARPAIFNVPLIIALVLLTIIGSVGAVLTIAFYRYEKQELTQYVRAPFIALADGLAPLVREAYRRRNYDLLQNTLQTFAAQGEIAFALVVDADSVIVASMLNTWQNRPFREFGKERQLELVEIPQPNTTTTFFRELPAQHLYLIDRQFHEAVADTDSAKSAGTLRGRLLLGYDSRFVVSRAAERWRQVLLLGGLILLAGALAFYLVVHIFLIRPLRSMSRVMSEVTEGNLTARCPDATGLPEVTNLIRRFNDMLAVRKVVEETLAYSEARFRSVVDAAQDAIIAVDSQQRLAFFNRAAERIFGYAPAEIAGHAVARLFPVAAAQAFARLMQNHAEVATPGAGQVYELQAQHKNGTLFPIELTIAATGRIPAGAHAAAIVYTAVIRDVTLKKRTSEEMQKLQEQLFQAQKMETIGTLAGGVAHDFNNLLVGILGTASLMKATVDAESLLQEHIQTIEQAALRASELTKQLLGFARAGKYEVRVVNLNHPLEELLRLISRTFEKRITVTAQLAEDLWATEGDSNQLQHSFLNICLNARDAMPEGGALKLTTQNLAIDAENSARHFNLAPGKYVHLTITDTGIGMDAATQARIFEPFFSTKERGKGTGLGLAMVYGIIRNHGGRIYVDSIVNQGTTFHIYLPATTTQAAVSKPEPPRAAPFGHETILLIDDERVILDVASRILKRLGYVVLQAENGEEALRLFSERHHEIALVILDMVMPRLSGREVFRRLQAINPEVRVLLSSGYSADGDAQAILHEGIIGFVQKPYIMNELAQAVKHALQPLETAIAAP